MKLRLCHAALTVCLLVALVCSLERRAYGYVDPGSGLLAYQTIAAFCAGTLYYFRQKVKRLFQPLRPAGVGAKEALKARGSSS